MVTSVPDLSETLKSKPQQFLSCSNNQSDYLLHQRHSFFSFSRSVNFHRSKSLLRIFLVYQPSYISLYSLVGPHYFLRSSRFKVHWYLLTPKPGSFPQCRMCHIKGPLLFLHSQCIQHRPVCIIFTIPCVLWNGSVSSLLRWGSERKCVLLLASAEVVLMSPGADTAGSGHGPITTAHYFYMMIWNRLRDQRKTLIQSVQQRSLTNTKPPQVFIVNRIKCKTSLILNWHINLNLVLFSSWTWSS